MTRAAARRAWPRKKGAVAKRLRRRGKRVSVGGRRGRRFSRSYVARTARKGSKLRRAAHRGRSKGFRINSGRFMTTVKGILKTAIPVVITIGVARLASANVTRIPGVAGVLGKAGQYADIVVSAALVGAGYFATQKIAPLRKHSTAILTGLGINFVVSAAKTFLPASVKGMIGLSGDGLYDMGQVYAEMGQGNYIETGDQSQGEYLETGEYMDIAGFESDLGSLEQELGADAQMLAPVPSVPQLAPVRHQAMVAHVPHYRAGMSEHGLYTGIFGGLSLHS